MLPTGNVWNTTDEKGENLEFVAKQSSESDTANQAWPLFQDEVEMQKRFQESPFIRRMVDYAPVSDTTSSPVIILEAFEQTLWDVRNTRQLSSKEIKWIMKAVLLALWTIHREGLVYSGWFNTLVSLTKINSS
jgi:protein kinase